MAWTQGSPPSGAINLERAWYGSAGRWLFANQAQTSLYATSDLATYGASTCPSSPLGQIAPLGACSDGTKWHVVGDNGYFSSTDGLTGAAWEVSSLETLYAAGGQRGGRAIHFANGRLVVVSLAGTYSVSADNGATWTYKGQLTSPSTNSKTFTVSNQGQRWVISAGSAAGVAISENNGDTWVHKNNFTQQLGPAGFFPGGIMAYQLGAQLVTLFEGAPDWTVPTYASTDIRTLPTTPYALYEWDNVTDLIYSFSTPDGSRAAVDMTGAPAFVNWFAAGDRLVITESTGPGIGPYFADVIGPNVVILPIVIEVIAPPIVTLPISIQVIDGSSVIALPIALTVSAPAVLTLTIALQVFDAETVGGLDGAGGWPAAPGGRWQPVVFLGGSDISAQLAGQITVTQADNEASVAEFAFRPVSPMLPMSLIGQPVRITFAQWTSTGPISAHTIFSGVVETPSIDLATGLVSCLCHDQLQEIAANTPRTWIDAEVGGRWREEVSGLPADTWDYLQARIASVPKSYALDALQRMRVMPWRGAGLKTATIRQADILDGSLSIDLPSRSQLRTRVTCRMQYRYTRLRGRGALASYSQPIRFYTGDFRAVAVASGGPFYGVLGLTVAMVESAVAGLSGWSLSGPISYDKPAAGSYLLGDVVGDGVYIIPPEVAPSIALGFTAKFESRWTQTTTEDYTVTVTLPGVEADTGPIGEEVGATLEAVFDAPEWGSDPAVSPALTVPTAGDVSSAWQPAGADAAARDEVLRTMLDRAWVTLYGSTRSGRVRFAMPLRPDLWLDWAPTLELTAIRAAGKIAEITHTLDLDTGAATTEAAIAVGLPGNTDASLPTWSLPAVTMPDETRPLTSYGFDLGTHVGGGDGVITRPPEAGGGPSPPFDAETMIGFVTNLDLAVQSTSFNWYPHQLSLLAPTIDAIDRDPLELPAEATIETTIPTDLLEIL